MKTQQEELQLSHEELVEKAAMLEQLKQNLEFTKLLMETKAKELALASRLQTEFPCLVVCLKPDEKLKNKPVLIVDDDERNRFVLSSYLDMLEMKVFTANDGKAAMNILKSGKSIDLILLDIMMAVI